MITINTRLIRNFILLIISKRIMKIVRNENSIELEIILGILFSLSAIFVTRLIVKIDINTRIIILILM